MLPSGGQDGLSPFGSLKPTHPQGKEHMPVNCGKILQGMFCS